MGADAAVTGEDREPGLAHPEEREAVVRDLLPQGKCRVELTDGEPSGRMVLAHPTAATKANFVRLRPGDRVLVVLSPHDRTRGRVTKVLRTV